MSVDTTTATPPMSAAGFQLILSAASGQARIKAATPSLGPPDKHLGYAAGMDQALALLPHYSDPGSYERALQRAAALAGQDSFRAYEDGRPDDERRNHGTLNALLLALDWFRQYDQPI